MEIERIRERFIIDQNYVRVISSNGEVKIPMNGMDGTDQVKMDGSLQVRREDNSNLLVKTRIFESKGMGVRSIAYPIELPMGGNLKIIEGTGGEKAVVAYNNQGKAVGGFYQPEARTKHFNRLETWFTLNGNLLVQNVLLDEEINEAVDITLRATALDYWHFYSLSHWITRGTGQYSMSLSVHTKPWAQWGTFAQIGWQVLADRHRNDGIHLQGMFRPYFRGNEDGLHNQWLCHYMTVGHFKEWNLEPGRPNPGLAATIQAKCNPIH